VRAREEQDLSFAATFPERLVIAGTGLETTWLGPGPDEAPTLVLLHEGLGCIGTWGRFPERLAQATGCGVFVYSRAGYGRSDPIEPPRPLTYMHDEALQTLGPLLDRIGFRRGVLVGHSDGASIAAIYAGGIQDHRVRGLVLMAPHFFTEPMGLDGIARAKTAFETTDLRQRLARHHGGNVDGAFQGWARAWLDPGFRTWDIREYLPHIRVPILLIQGLDDTYGTLAQVEAAEAGTMAPCEPLLLAGCGHAPHHEAADATLAGSAGFIARLMAVDAIPGPLPMAARNDKGPGGVPSP
jgi:pimeloyl-ACP methyl ester carboxylesterase